MTLCTWCGQQITEDAESCASCGGYPDRPHDWSYDHEYEVAEGRRLEYLRSQDNASRLDYVPRQAAAWQQNYQSPEALSQPESFVPGRLPDQATDPPVRYMPTEPEFQRQAPLRTGYAPDEFAGQDPLRTSHAPDEFPGQDALRTGYAPDEFPGQDLHAPSDPTDQEYGWHLRDDAEPVDHIGDWQPSDLSAPAASPRARSGRWTVLAAASTVLVIAAVIVVLALTHHKSGTSGNSGGRPSAATTTPRSHTPAPSPVVSGTRMVAVSSAAAAAPHADAVVSLLTRYFSAINSHDYLAYRRLFATSIRSGLTQAAFTAGYGTTHDSHASVRSIEVTATGEIAALVTFISRQQPSQSPTGSACTRWSVTLYLSGQGQRYFLVAPPTGYSPSYRSCR